MKKNKKRNVKKDLNKMLSIIEKHSKITPKTIIDAIKDNDNMDLINRKE